MADTSPLLNHEKYSFPIIHHINGIEFDGTNYLWACNDSSEIFRVPINEDYEIGEIDRLYCAVGYQLYDMTTDKNGNYWVLAYSKEMDRGEIIKIFAQP